MNYPRPPAHIEPYVRILGVEGAVDFFLHYGGGELYIPRKAVAGSELAELLGLDAAQKLALAADRLPKRVPTAKPWIAAVWLYEGLSATQIARRLHTSDVAVRRWLKRYQSPPGGSDKRQLPLI